MKRAISAHERPCRRSREILRCRVTSNRTWARARRFARRPGGQAQSRNILWGCTRPIRTRWSELLGPDRDKHRTGVAPPLGENGSGTAPAGPVRLGCLRYSRDASCDPSYPITAIRPAFPQLEEVGQAAHRPRIALPDLDGAGSEDGVHRAASVQRGRATPLRAREVARAVGWH
jgi:hypothetical protein